MSNSNEIITQWGLAKDGYQFQRTLWESHDFTLHPMFICVGFLLRTFQTGVIEYDRKCIEM
jgi:hypothetical protein